MGRAFQYFKPSPVKCLCPDCATHITLSLVSNSLCKIANNPTLFLVYFELLPIDFKNARACQLTDICRMLLFQRLIQVCRLYIGTRYKWTRNKFRVCNNNIQTQVFRV